VRLRPVDARALRTRGAVKEVLGDKDGAAADYTEAIRLDPNDVRLYLARGTVFAQQGKLEESLRDRNRAVELDRRTPKLMSNAPPHTTRWESMRKGWPTALPRSR